MRFRLYLEKIVLFGAVFALLLACDESSVSSVSEKDAATAVVNSEKELPKCSGVNEGERAFVKGDSFVRLCVDGDWVNVLGPEKDTVYLDEDVHRIPAGEKISCVTETLPDRSGRKIVCNGDSIGVVLNGKKGEQGADGDAGPKGEKGETGDVGDAGPKGEKGETGDVGDAGPKGEKGETGDVGDVGPKGEKGENGDAGKPGVKGKTGDVGDPGADGKNGQICITEAFADGSGYRVVCDGDSVGVIVNGGYLLDTRDGQRYKTTVIGDKVWMAQNLNYRYHLITAGGSEVDSSSYCFDDDPANCEKYGRLYLWSAAMDSAGIVDSNNAAIYSEIVKSSQEFDGVIRGACPVGWHLPTFHEYNLLLITVAGEGFVSRNSYKAKTVVYNALASTSGWEKCYANAALINGLDTYGFNVLPAGYRLERETYGKFFARQDTLADFWTSTFLSRINCARDFYLSCGNINLESIYTSRAYSVRCIKD